MDTILKKNKIKNFIKKTLLFKFVVWYRRKKSNFNHIKSESQKNIYSFSPVHEVIRSIASEHSVKIFFETGTYIGNTVFGVKDAFEKVYSVELSKELAKLARERFANEPKVKIINSDSSNAIKSFLKDLTEPAVFWLDAHYSTGITAMGKKQTPIREELEAILKHSIKGHHILIDDVKDFNGQNDYPTATEIIEMVKEIGYGRYQVQIEGEVFRIYPMQTSDAIVISESKIQNKLDKPI
jgi:hypothetical protein